MPALKSYRWRKIWIYLPWSLSLDMSTSHYFHSINHIREIPVLWEINLKNWLYCLHFALNIPNGKRKVYMNSVSELCIFLSLRSRLSVWKQQFKAFLRSGRTCAFVFLMETAFSGASWHLGQTDSLFTFNVSLQRLHAEGSQSYNRRIITKAETV